MAAIPHVKQVNVAKIANANSALSLHLLVDKSDKKHVVLSVVVVMLVWTRRTTHNTAELAERNAKQESVAIMAFVNFAQTAHQNAAHLAVAILVVALRASTCPIILCIVVPVETSAQEGKRVAMENA